MLFAMLSRALVRLILLFCVCLPGLARAELDVAWLRDPGGRLDVTGAAARAAAFQPLPGGSLSHGYTRDVYWLRLTLPADLNGAHWLEIPPAVLDDVRLYVPRPPGGWQERRSGDQQPFSSREAPFRTAAFELAPVLAGQVLYVRLQTTSMMAAGPRLWHENALRATADAELLGYGVYLGLMATVALFNLVSWLMTRRSLYAVFALFLLGNLLRWMALDGTANQFLFPDRPAIIAVLVTPLLGGLLVAGALFQMNLLQLRHHHRWLLRFYQVAVVLGLLLMLTPLIGNVGLLSSLIFAQMLLGPVLSAPAYWRLWREGGLAGRLVAVALPLHFLLMLPSNLSTLGWLSYDPAAMRLAHFTDLPLVLLLHASIVLRGREAERERNAALAAGQRERDAREEQAQFLAMISHEVRTPIAVIDAAAYSLRLLDGASAELAARASRYTSIGQAVSRMKTLMELAETHGRLAPGERALEAAPLDLAVLTGEALAVLEPAAAARVVVAAAPAGALPPLRGDARLLYFALLNLFDNALKYAVPDTPITVDIVAQARGVLWRIRDHGCGIPAHLGEAIFEKYHRLDETAGHPGLGLGLPLARQIVERHGGYLRLDRAWCLGAGFELWLPERA